MPSSPDSLKPLPLAPGGAIGDISPSKWGRPEQLRAAGNRLEAQGYRLVWRESNQAREHQFAGPPTYNPGDPMYRDEDIRVNIC